MSAIIKVRTISAATETAIQLANAQFARKVNFGTGWSTLRLGMRLHMGDTGADISGTPRLVFGFCSGTSNIYGDATTTHFVGARTTAATWNRSATFYNNATCVPTKRVGSTSTDGTSMLNLVVPNGALSNTADRYIFFLDVIKGSPNFTMKLFCDQTGTSGDKSQATFLAQMEQASPALSGYTYSGGQTLAVDEATNGTLDSINVSWSMNTPVQEICDIAVARIA